MKKNFTKILTLFLTFIMLSAVPAMAYSNDPYPNSYLPLTDFNIISYGSDGGTTYSSSKPNREVLNDRALSLTAIQQGNGDISYISIDGKEVPYSDYNDNKVMFEKNERREITAWKHTVRIKPYVIEKLALGSHRICIVCSGQKYTTKDAVLVDSVAFNLIKR